MKYLYRTVNFLLAAAVFPVVIFLNLIDFRIGSGLISTVGLQDGISIKFIIDAYRGVGEGTANFIAELLVNNDSPLELKWPEALNPVKGDAIAFLVFFIIGVVVAIFIMAWSCFSNKRLPVLAASVTGLISTIGMYITFGNVVDPIVKREIPLSSIVGGEGFIRLILDIAEATDAIGLDGIRLGGFHMGLVFIFIGLLVWTASYYLIEIGDSPEEKALAQAKSKKKTR